MANVSITLSGITEALENLNRGSGSAKDSVTTSSRGLFPSDTTADIIGFRCVSKLFQ